MQYAQTNYHTNCYSNQKKPKILKIDSDWMNSFHTQITTKKNSWVNFYGLHNFGLEVWSSQKKVE